MYDSALVWHAVALYMQACCAGRAPKVWDKASDTSTAIHETPTPVLEAHLRFLTRRCEGRSPAAHLLAERNLRDADSFWDAGDGYLIYTLTVQNELDRRRS